MASLSKIPWKGDSMVDENHVARLLPEAREMLDKSMEERIGYIRQDRWIPYPEADRILAKLEAFYNMPKKARAPSMLLVGDSNCGKSSLVRRFLDMHPPTDGVYEAACSVYYLASCPPEPDEGRLYEEILQDILIPFRYSDKPSKKMAEIEYQFELMGVRVIILDEIHNAMSGSSLKQRTFLNAIKNLHNTMQRPIVLVGTQEAQFVMTSDTQFASRFKMEPLKRWDEDIEFQKFLAKLELTLPFAKSSLLASTDMSKSIYKRAESGCIGDFVDLVVEAAVLAINNGRERITNKEIKECDFIPSSKKPPSEKLDK
jgi:GTPase SAR1 family protein